MKFHVHSKPQMVRFEHVAGYCYVLSLPDHVADSDGPFKIGASSIVLREDDNPVGPKMSLVDDVIETGGGSYVYFGDALFFSTSDASDPNENARVYELFIRGHSVGAFSSSSRTFAGLPYGETDSHTFVDMRGTPILREFYDEFQRRNTCKLKGLQGSKGRAALFLRIGNSGSSAAFTSIRHAIRTFSFGGRQQLTEKLNEYFGNIRSETKTHYEIYATHDKFPILKLMECYAQYFTVIRDPRKMIISKYYWEGAAKGEFHRGDNYYDFDKWLDRYYNAHKGRHTVGTLPIISWFTHLDQPIFTIFEEIVTNNFQKGDFFSPFEKAMKVASELFFFIGISEYFDESIFILYLLLDVPLMPLWGHHLRSPKPDAGDFTAEHMAKIEELVSTDLRFYTYWRRAFEDGFAKEIEFFRSNIMSLRGFIVPRRYESSSYLAQRFHSSAATGVKGPEIIGPLLAIRQYYIGPRFEIRRYYTAEQRLEWQKARPGGWSATRSNLRFDERILGPDLQPGVLQIVEDTSKHNTHDIRLSLSAGLEGQGRTVFAFVKAAGRTRCALWLYASDVKARAVADFSLATGEVKGKGLVGQGWHNVRAGCVRVQEEWWWIWLSAETGFSAPASATLQLRDDVGSAAYDGDGQSGIFVFDPRLEGRLYDWGW